MDAPYAVFHVCVGKDTLSRLMYVVTSDTGADVEANTSPASIPASGFDTDPTNDATLFALNERRGATGEATLII